MLSKLGAGVLKYQASGMWLSLLEFVVLVCQVRPKNPIKKHTAGIFDLLNYKQFDIYLVCDFPLCLDRLPWECGISTWKVRPTSL